jgi:hypothetical protein
MAPTKKKNCDETYVQIVLWWHQPSMNPLCQQVVLFGFVTDQ